MKVGNITRRVAGESGESACPGRDTGGLGVQVSGAGLRAAGVRARVAFLDGSLPPAGGREERRRRRPKSPV